MRKINHTLDKENGTEGEKMRRRIRWIRYVRKLMLKRLCWISPELNPFMNGSQVQILKTLALTLTLTYLGHIKREYTEETNPNSFRTYQK